MCISKPHIPDAPPPPVLPEEKKVELGSDKAKKSAQQKAGRAGTRSLQISLGGSSSKASGLKIPS